MELSGKTKAVILIGNPVEHSISPKMHTIAFKNVGIDAIYIAAKVETNNVKTAVESIRALNFSVMLSIATPCLSLRTKSNAPYIIQWPFSLITSFYFLPKILFLKPSAIGVRAQAGKAKLTI